MSTEYATIQQCPCRPLCSGPGCQCSCCDEDYVGFPWGVALLVALLLGVALFVRFLRGKQTVKPA